MRERPIIFSSTMVRPILEGRKTQTRRIVRERDLPSPEYEYGRPCPYGVPGDRLWVRETWYCDHCFSGDYEATRRNEPGSITDAECIALWKGDDRTGSMMYYRADGDACDQFEQLDSPSARIWKSPLHMPRWASRITLEVTDVRVERLQDISHDDSVAEGMAGRADFIGLWENINGRDSWKANPWIWAITFARVMP